MARPFSKETILQGSLDYLCLVCECYIKTERDVCLHVSTLDHKQNLDSADYVDKYRDDRIRKVKKWYHCEFCNIVVSTIINVQLHITESRHKNNVASQEIARMDDIIISGNFVISEDTWHGFINDNTCIICNIEFENMDDHRKEFLHIINLIHSTVDNDFNSTYRKINDSTFHCLNCNIVVVDIIAHLDNMQHKEILKNHLNLINLTLEDIKKENINKEYSQSTKETDIISEKNNPSNENDNYSSEVRKESGDINAGAKAISNEVDRHDVETSAIDINNDGKVCIVSDSAVDIEIKDNPDGTHDQNMLKTHKNFGQKSKSNADKNNDNITFDIVNSIEKFQNESINIKLESRTAVCRRCTVNLDFDPVVIDNHIKDHKSNIQVETNSTMLINNDENKVATVTNASTVVKTKENKDDIIQQMALQHDLICDANKLYCKRCDKLIPKSVKKINKHVNGALHSSKTTLTDKSTHLKDNENKKVTEKKNNLIRILAKNFIRSRIVVETPTTEVVINERYIINFLAYVFVTPIDDESQLRCNLCEVNVDKENLVTHLKGNPIHDTGLDKVPVIVNDDSEFIREIRSGTFHCGFCNLFDSWEGMENHLKSTAHKEGKTFSSWRLQLCLPNISWGEIHYQLVINEILRSLSYLLDLKSALLFVKSLIKPSVVTSCPMDLLQLVTTSDAVKYLYCIV